VALSLLSLDILSIIAGVSFPILYNSLVLRISASLDDGFFEPLTYFNGVPLLVFFTGLNFLAIIVS